MKKCAKVFIWIGIIFQFFLIYPIVVGVIALQKLDEATQKEDVQTVAILTLLFCNMVGGIIMLTMTDNDLSQNKVVIDTTVSTKKVTHNSNELLHKILSVSILGAILISFIFSLIPLICFGEAFIPFILTIVQIVVDIVLIVTLFVKKKNKKISIFLSFTIIGLSIAVIVLSILHCCGDALIYGSPFDVPDLDILIGCIICSAIVIFTVSVLVFSLIKSKEKTKEINATENNSANLKSAIETELEEVKSLFEKGLLNDNNYNLTKQEIIKNYYNTGKNA